jgi:two-component system phosphate regulon sensor histidine kinase PhoR
MSFRYFPIADLVRDAIDEMRPAAERKRIDLRLESSGPEGLKAYGDRDRLKQVLINLIDNAIKYTETGGTVRCAAAEEGGKCWVSVSDTGVGIAAEHLPRIFERFYRVDRDRSRQVGGTGLGLAIVKHIVEAHGGSIAVTSTPGTGSTFTVWLRK